MQAPKDNSDQTRSAGAFTVRPAKPEDVPAILGLERQAETAAHWSESAYRELFAPTAPTRIALVLEIGDHSISGFVMARVTGDECELENVVVSRGLQRRGAGTQLVYSLIAAACKQNVHSIFLEVRESNTAARALYERCGFAITGRRPRYYSNPEEDSILYSIRL